MGIPGIDPPDILYMHTNHTITCYIFRTSGDLIHFFPCDQRTSDISISVPTMLPAPAHCMSRQQDFYLALSGEDADKFAAFCRSSSPRTQIPALLLFPDHQYAAVFAERYTAQTLSHSDPLPGNTAAFLGQSAMQTLRTVLPNHHLIPALLFSSMKELYSITSPVYTLMPETVRALISELEHLQEPDAIFTQTLPFLRSYQKELSATDIPVFLNIPAAISQMLPMLSDRPLFQNLQIRFRPSDISPGIYHTRLSLSVFTYLFVLLTYITGLLDDDHITNISLYRDGTDACLVFRAETDILPHSLSCRSEFFSLLPHLPRYESLLSLTQYLLHRNGIRFTCTVSRNEYPSINFTLRMDTRIREEIEFRVGDIDDKLSTALPEALDLLAHLIAPPPADPEAK